MFLIISLNAFFLNDDLRYRPTTGGEKVMMTFDSREVAPGASTWDMLKSGDYPGAKKPSSTFL
jgi:hypothetical protein